MQAILHAVEPLSKNVKTFWFRTERRLEYVAGQFIELTIPHTEPDERGDRRWFTVSSSPNDEYIAITTKHAERPSSFKMALFSLELGDSVTISQSMGDFVLPKDQTIPLIYVVGGIGVTPAHSMLKWLRDVSQKRSINVLYAARTETDLIFHELLEESANNIEYFVSEPTKDWNEAAKILKTEDILKAINNAAKPLVYLSGPEELIEVLVAELKESGVNGSRLVTDYFPGYGSI